MAKQSNDIMLRRADRAQRIIDRTKDTAIKVAGPPVLDAAAAFAAADADIGKVATAERQERKERDAAADPLGRVYDKVRSATLVRLPHAEVSGRSKSLGTSDDVINAAEKIEDLLCVVAGVDADHPRGGTGTNAPTGEPWALALIGELQDPLSAAVKESDEASAASAVLQKAQQARADTRALLHTRILAFRRVVRDVYGPQSREYHSLRDRNMPKDEDEEPPADPPGTPAAG